MTTIQGKTFPVEELGNKDGKILIFLAGFPDDWYAYIYEGE